MNWSTLEAGLQGWFAAVSGIDQYAVAWSGQPEGFRDFPQADLLLSRSGGDVGIDETRYEVDAEGRLVPYIAGNRVATLTIIVRSRDQHGNARADSILERVRTALFMDITQQAFEALGVVMRDAAPTQSAAQTQDLREMSVASLTVTLGYAVYEVAALLPPIEPVEHVVVSGHVDPIGDVPDKVIP